MKKYFRNFLIKYLPGILSEIRRFRYENFMLPKTFLNHMNSLSDSHIVIDLGANAGRVTEALARRGAKVFAFEPNSIALEKLQLVANKYSNIEVRNEAAGLRNQKIKLYLNEGGVTQSSSLLDDKPNVSSEMFEIVSEIDFSEFLKSFNTPIELIKIDIEGYEIQLINHLLNTNSLENVKMIYVETHERKFKELVSQTNALKERVIEEGLDEKFFFDWH